MRCLPPLNALRAFEAAARHQSFRDAAAELHVTPAAISHQIKGLEEHLGVDLFRRLNREVRLTDAGRDCLPALREAFDRIGEAMDRVRRDDGGLSGMLTVSAAPSIAGKWLLPRLDRFRDVHPDIDIRLDATMTVTDFARDDVHVALRYGRGHYPGLYSELLLRNEVFPVCAPALMRGPRALRQPADLRHHILLHEDSAAIDPSHPDWSVWLRAAGVANVDATRGPRFTHSPMLVDAVVAGRGVALGRSVIVGDDLAAGRLVRPFGENVKVDFAFYFVCPPAALTTPKIKAFRDWIMAEAKTTAAADTAKSTSRKGRPPREK
jgi:LysR family transcriptional regulator, glycine cleavage system transcriptional activator